MAMCIVVVPILSKICIEIFVICLRRAPKLLFSPISYVSNLFLFLLLFICTTEDLTVVHFTLLIDDEPPPRDQVLAGGG